MDEFLEKMRNAQHLRSVTSVDGLSARVARVMLSVFNLGDEPLDACRLSKFYERCPNFPVRLYPERYDADLEVMFKYPFKTKLWENYIERRSSSTEENVGIAATLGKSTIYVLHGLMTLPTPCGSMLQLKHVDGVEGRFETLAQFLDSVRKVWTP